MTTQSTKPIARAEKFAERLGIRVPVLLSPMAGACPVSLSVAVANAGGLGACGALLMTPAQIRAWCEEFRRESAGQFQMNLWIPEPRPVRDAAREAAQREWLTGWGPAVGADAGEAVLPDFDTQCEALLEAAPRAISSIMGVYAPEFVAAMKARGILWFAVATTVDEAQAAAAAGADAIVAQGSEAGGHRGSFVADDAERNAIGLFALLPQIVDAVDVPVIATGGIADARGVAAALTLGASAVQVGTGFLRTPEAKIHPAWAAKLAETGPNQTALTRSFTGRAGRAIVNEYVEGAAMPGAPPPAPYPVQRGLTRAMREAALAAGDTTRMQMWAGQSAHLAQAKPSADTSAELWEGAKGMLR